MPKTRGKIKSNIFQHLISDYMEDHLKKIIITTILLVITIVLELLALWTNGNVIVVLTDLVVSVIAALAVAFWVIPFFFETVISKKYTSPKLNAISIIFLTLILMILVDYLISSFSNSIQFAKDGFMAWFSAIIGGLACQKFLDFPK